MLLAMEEPLEEAYLEQKGLLQRRLFDAKVSRVLLAQSSQYQFEYVLVRPCNSAKKLFGGIWLWCP
jgi:hypothetical protein